MHIYVILGLIAAYFSVILGFVLYARYKTTQHILPGISEFFLASKNLSPLVLTCTYVASLFSTFSILGLPALMYAHGLSAIYFIAFTDFFGLILLVVIGKKLHRAACEKQIFSPIEAISAAYNSQKLGFVLALVFALSLLPYIALQLVGIGAFIDSYSDGRIDYVTGVGAMMAIVLLYLFLGGMRAVAYTDFIQLVAMVVGLLFGALFLCHHFDYSLTGIFGDLHEKSPLHFIPPGAKDAQHWPLILSMAVVTAGVFIQPHLLTRAIMARKESDINYMVVGTVIGRLITTFLAVFLGSFAFLHYGANISPNMVMGEIFKEIGALGIIGTILAAFMIMGALGAAMSTADSLLISIGQIATRDMIRPFMVIDQKHQVILSKAIMTIILVGAFVVGLNPPRYMTDLAIYSGAIAAILVPTFLSFAWPKRSRLAAYCSIFGGAAALITLGILKAQGQYPWPAIHIGLVPMALSFVLYYGVAVLNPKRTLEDPLLRAQE